MITQRVFRILLSLLIVAIFLLHATRTLDLPFFSQMENQAYDMRLKATLRGGVDPRVVILDIDEKSLARIGRWPWGRDRLAEMVDTLFEHYKVKLLAFDVVFAERDESSGLSIMDALARGPLKNNPQYLSELEARRPQLERDQVFAKSLRDRPIILGYFFTHNKLEAGNAGALPEPIVLLDESIQDRIPFSKAAGFGANLEILQHNALGGGFFNNSLVDGDGIFRRVPLVEEYDNALYESLALAIARHAQGGVQAKPHLVTDSSGTYHAIEAWQLGDYAIPVDEQSSVLVPFRGPQGSFPYVSIIDVLERRVDPQVLEDRIVLVGATAAGLLDLRATPVQNIYPGVEVHANIVSGILDQSIKQRPAYTLGYEVVLLTLLGILMTALLPILTAVMTAVLTLLITGLVIVGNMLAWQHWNLVLPVATPVMMVFWLFVLHVAWGFFVESRGKRHLARMFGQYVPPELVDEMDNDFSEISLDGESREMTVLFSDVRGFTTISEGLNPKELTQLMNAFLTPMTRIIHKHRGTIDKYMGDAVMAFWGAPLRDPQHARNAMLAAMDMIETLEQLQASFSERGWPAIKVGVGINSGIMNVGNMGSEFRMAYTVLGDSVNLGSRLEGLTKQYGVQLIVSEYTRHEVPEFEYRELDVVRVKGKDKPVAIFEPLGLIETIDRATKSELRRYRASLKLYREQQWDAAERELFSLAQANPACRVYTLYLDRIVHLRNDPPGPEWDGVTTFQTK